MGYTHLMVRSGYSLMDSTITIEKLVGKAKELGYGALALTDEHVLYGAVPFYKACIKHGIKPIIGMIVQVEIDEVLNEVILLAKTNKGYQNLVRLTTAIQMDQQDKINLETLHYYASDLICILPATNETLAALLINSQHDEVLSYIHEWKQGFETDAFYIGIQDDHGQESVSEALKAFHETYQMPVVAICDVHYLDERDDIAYDLLKAMHKGEQWGMKLSSPDVRNKHLRSPFEMEQSFRAFWPEVLEETEVIKAMCNVTFDFTKRLLPSFPVPDGMDANTYLEKQCKENINQKYDNLTPTILERLEYELRVISAMGFSDYFLIVADFIRYAKEQNILVGPGRGSSAGSLVAYVLGITDVDPIKYHLLFERFLNPERRTMPDIDVDFSDIRRDEVIDYVREKYGDNHVAQIITFGTFAARSLIRELIKTMDVDQQDAFFILKQIPLQSKKSLADILQDSKDLSEYVKQSQKLKVLFAIAIKLEGIPRHISTHAAGVVISEKPLIEHVPLTRGVNDTHLTQFTMNDLESLGLLKMDFLGLRNLSLLEKIIRSINYTTKKQVSLDTIPEEDEKTYDMLRNGLTNGVFQLESQGMKNVLTQLKPTAFEDIVAVNALYRPGPMDFIPTYIARKHKQEKVTYLHPDIKAILEDTYGVLVYQEQIMQIAHRIAGFTFGQADILRRAVSKKKQDIMEAQQEAFIDGCIASGYTKAVAEEIFSWIVKFSNYGFPRSHAVAYSKISYQLSFLKAHFPANFFAELLSSSRNQQEKLNLYLKEIKETNIALLAPSINKSFGNYSVENNQIRMGLRQIKGMGNQAITEIIHARKDRRFKNLFDFCMRVDRKLVGRNTIENLVMVGAFDETYTNRASLLASIDQAIDQAELFKEFNDQSSLFTDQIELEAEYVKIEDFTVMKKLADEKELLGMYVSSHPLKEHRQALRNNGYITIQHARRQVGKRNVKSVVVIESVKVIRTKRGDSMAFLTISDETSDMDAVIFPDLYRKTNRFMKEEQIITITGKVELRNDRLQWVLDEIEPFEEGKLEPISNQRLFIKVTRDKTSGAIENIKQIADSYPGSTVIFVHQESSKQTYLLANEYSIYPSNECIKLLRNFFGKDNVILQKK
ncbi:DNA polymerase III subunit alpha [Oceanobacillus bengalensis]|uniref:DNA polymerase III subunit alpha n=1 Tax=Oceanobacillus bengalensis TaxID=1435466 RepID=A0A494YWR7_9BACI|nr:DNA polymerase III subunit alpha [Oceanobacillus bengalensis]RKQ14669.1 DNA polymerase III subunit alpha [Oceanobacillus bengalensis]